VAVYEQLAHGYATRRRPDPRIAAQLWKAAGSAGPIINVGAGSGSYEPTDVSVIAVEPSEAMVRQRSPDAAPAVRAAAEQLPFGDGEFAAGMAILTVHHWRDVERGLAELRRVVRGRIAVMTWDQEVFSSFWMVAEYVPASLHLDRELPRPEHIAALLGGGTVEVVPVPSDCTDGFYAAYWQRPHAYLDPAVRSCISGLARLGHEEIQPGLDRLAQDLTSGTWKNRHRALLDRGSFDAGYRLVVSSGA
jgi:SAM-dependent methyltransferase